MLTVTRQRAVISATDSEMYVVMSVCRGCWLVWFVMRLTGVIAMHLETLDAVHQESKRLPPIPKVFLALFYHFFYLHRYQTGFPRLLESPGSIFVKLQALESPGKCSWFWKVLEILVKGPGKSFNFLGCDVGADTMMQVQILRSTTFCPICCLVYMDKK